MRTELRRCAFALLLSAVLPAAAAAAVLASAVGSVTLVAGGARTPGKAGAPLPPGAKLMTAPGAEALVLLADGSKIRVSENSVFEFEGEGRTVTNLRLLKGLLTAWVRKQERRRLDIGTPSAVASVRGTVTSAEASGARSRFVLYRGRLLVTDRFGRTTDMPEGHSSEVRYERGLGGTTPLPPGTRAPEEPPVPAGLEKRASEREADEKDEVEGPEIESERERTGSPEQETSIDADDFVVSPSAP